MKVAICLPLDDEVKTKFAFSMWGLLRGIPREAAVTIVHGRGSLIPHVRYHLVKSALDDHGADAVMFIDSDLSFPEDSLARLMAHDLPIVGATYVMRRPPYVALGVGIDDIEPGATGLRQMYRMPVGFCLIRAEVFRDTPKPWFPVGWDPSTELIIGEDYGFCDLARTAGFDLFCDLDLSHELGHESTQTLWWGGVADGPETETVGAGGSGL